MSELYRSAHYTVSATQLSQLPPDSGFEVAFAGRSNAGKSSAINTITGIKALARISKTPGRTQMINFFHLDDERAMVDLPGYGFAKVPKKERERWGRSIRKYLSERESLRLILSVIDARHEPSALDQDFFYWLASNEMPFCVLMSKADKLSNNKFAQSKKAVKNILAEMNIEVPILGYSASSRKGIPEIQELIQDFIRE